MILQQTQNQTDKKHLHMSLAILDERGIVSDGPCDYHRSRVYVGLHRQLMHYETHVGCYDLAGSQLYVVLPEAPLVYIV